MYIYTQFSGFLAINNLSSWETRYQSKPITKFIQTGSHLNSIDLLSVHENKYVLTGFLAINNFSSQETWYQSKPIISLHKQVAIGGECSLLLVKLHLFIMMALMSYLLEFEVSKSW